MMHPSIDISKEAFVVPRTPGDLAQYVRDAYECIASNAEMAEKARLRREPYKTFLEELVPFSAFCTWRHGESGGVLCSLVRGTPGRDAIIVEKFSGTEHSVEITWPIEGKHVIQRGIQLNERGITDLEIWDYHDLSKHQAAVSSTLKIAQKKALRDYTSPGGSTLLFVFDRELFWDSNTEHIAIVNSLVDQLRAIEFQVDTILLMLVLGDHADITVVKHTERPAAAAAVQRIDYEK